MFGYSTTGILKTKSLNDLLACINNQKGSPELGHSWRPSFYSCSLKWHHALWLSVISWHGSEQWPRSSPLVRFPKISLKQHLQGTALESKSLARQQKLFFCCRWLMASLLDFLCARTANPLHFFYFFFFKKNKYLSWVDIYYAHKKNIQKQPNQHFVTCARSVFQNCQTFKIWYSKVHNSVT